MLTEYTANIKVLCTYLPKSLNNTFGKWLMKHDKTQLRISETEKYVGGQLLVTVDHGNAEQMRYPATGQAHTTHTSLPVPLIYVGKPAKVVEGGKLSDIAPTILNLMGMKIPPKMTGKPLFIVE